jgi:tight adherence protein B
VTASLLACIAGFGTYLLWTAVAFGWRGIGPRIEPRPRRSPLPKDVLATAGVLFFVGAAAAFVLFGGALPPLVAGAFAATSPFAARRRRTELAKAAAREAWPRLVEEIRLQVGSLGRSIPQALFDVGRRAPSALRPAFAAAERQWLVTTDFARTVSLLKVRLEDATADAVLETLLVAHEVGGSSIDARLAVLAEDRRADLQGRKEAQAKQAGVRFARRFVLLVPLGMALAGLSIGTGRAAYGTSAGQVSVALGIAMVAACWGWAGMLLRLPEEQRVFTEDRA